MRERETKRDRERHRETERDRERQRDELCPAPYERDYSVTHGYLLNSLALCVTACKDGTSSVCVFERWREKGGISARARHY